MFDRKSGGVASNNKLSFEGLDDRHVTIYKWNPSSLEGRPRVRSEKAVREAAFGIRVHAARFVLKSSYIKLLFQVTKPCVIVISR